MFKKIEFSRAQIAFWRIVLIYMAPMLLVYFGLIPFKFHIPLMLGVVLFVFYFVHKDSLTQEDLGFCKKNKNQGCFIIYGFYIIGCNFNYIFCKKDWFSTNAKYFRTSNFYSFIYPNFCITRICLQKCVNARIASYF